MSVALLRLGPGDEGVLGRVAEGVFDEPVRPERVRAYLREPGHLLVVALDEGAEGRVVVGQCAGVVHRHPDKATELYVDEVGTADAWLRRGVARAMLAELFAWGREVGCEEAWLGTETGNEAARGLYRDAGGEEDAISYWEWDLRPATPLTSADDE